MEELIGCQVELLSSWRGYYRGTIIGISYDKYEIELPSGAIIYCYRSQFKID